MTPQDFNERVGRLVAVQLGAGQVIIDALQLLSERASRETWAFDAIYQQDRVPVRLPLVLRRETGSSGGRTSGRREFLLLRAAQAAGVPVPRVYWLRDERETLGAPFFVMERIAAETSGSPPDPKNLAGQLGEILARIHGIDPGSCGLASVVQSRPDRSPLAAVEDLDRRFCRPASAPRPAAEQAFGWLRRHLPSAVRHTVVHGDFRIENLCVGSGGVRAILGWQLAHVGDPMSDLGWLCVRSWGAAGDERLVGATGAREEVFAGYERAGGLRVDPALVRFWEVFATLELAMIAFSPPERDPDGRSSRILPAGLMPYRAEIEDALLDLTAG